MRLMYELLRFGTKRKDKKMNYIEQFMKDNDIEVNEEFYVTDEKGEKIGGLISIIFYFDKNMRLNMKLVESDCRDVLRGLMTGEYRIEKIPQKPKTVWDLKSGDEYYFINMICGVTRTTFSNDTYDTDKKIIEVGNAFLTREEADHEAERRKCEAILLKYGTRDMRSLGDINAHKYFIVYNNYYNELSISFNQSANSQGTIYFETSELAQKAIDEVTEERLKKYIFNVKE